VKRAEELLARQRDLVQRLAVPQFRRYVGISTALHRANVHVSDSHEVDERTRQVMDGPQPEMYAAHLESVARGAYLYQVTEDMCMVVQHAASALAELDRFHRDEEPTGCGMVYFERPMPIAEVRGRTMLGHWLIWGPAYDGDYEGAGTAMYWLNDTLDEADDVAQDALAEYDRTERRELYEMLGRWGPIGCDFAVDGMRMGPPILHPDAEVQAQMIAAGTISSDATNTARYAKALFFLLGQTLVATHEPHLRRTAARASRRMNLPGRVTVIDLRRSEGSRRDGESNVEWAHRWIVRGHPAWRKCSEDNPHAEPYEKGWRVRVYIAPFEKGPENKPLVVTDKLYRLRR
jgi:hypothetical protein